MEIKVNITSLAEAKNQLNNISSKLNKSNFMLDGMNLIEESSGSTFTSVNEAYRNLKSIETSIAILVEKTKIIIENAGATFQETDNNISKTINNNLNVK